MASGPSRVPDQLRSLVMGLLILALLLAITGAYGLLAVRSTSSEMTDVVAPAQALNTVVLADVNAVEQAARLWMATSRPADRDSYQRLLRTSAVHRSELADLTSGDPGLAGVVSRQEAAASRWVDSGFDDRGGTDLSSANLAVARALQDRAAADLALADRQRDWTLAALALLVALGSVGALVAARRIAREIVVPLTAVQAVVGRLAGGDYTARCEPSGPAEMRSLAEAVNRLADETERVLALEQTVVEQLRDLDRAKTDFLSTVSHELRTPLTSIGGYVELFEDDLAGSLSPGQSSMLRVVKRNVDRLGTLIEDLLTLSHAESDAIRTVFDTVDLKRVAVDVGVDVRATAGRTGITIEVVCPPLPVTVYGDGGQISRALLNLVSNAVKFSHPDSTVTVTVLALQDRAAVEVTDRGIGIPPRELPQLATRFYRASNAVDAEISGSGLGLRIVQSVADSHNGRLEIESVQGWGTTARLVLPAIAGYRWPVEEEEQPAADHRSPLAAAVSLDAVAVRRGRD